MENIVDSTAVCVLADDSESKACRRAYTACQKIIDVMKPNPPSPTQVPVMDLVMKNFPVKISPEELLGNLKRDLPFFFNHNDVTILFTDIINKGNQQRMAFVCNVRGRILDLMRKAFLFQPKFETATYQYQFHVDVGSEWGEDGSCDTLRSGSSLYSDYEKKCQNGRVGINIFYPHVTSKIREILNFAGPTTLLSNMPIICNEPWAKFLIMKQEENLKYKLSMASLVETIQFIRRMSGSTIDESSVVFDGIHGQVGDSFSGLGKHGNLIVFDEYCHSVRFDDMDQEILHTNFILSLESMACPRCGKDFNLLGICLNLTYLLAKCNCNGRSYSFSEWNSMLLPKNTPFHFPDEISTRLTIEGNHQSMPELGAFVSVPKMRNTYPSYFMMSNVLHAVIELEWQAKCADAFINRKYVDMLKVQNVGKIGNVNRHILCLVVTLTKFWNVTNLSMYRNVEIEVPVYHEGHSLPVLEKTLTGRLIQAKQLPYERLQLQYAVRLNENLRFTTRNERVLLIPKASDVVYIGNRNYIEEVPLIARDNPQKNLILSKHLVPDYQRSNILIPHFVRNLTFNEQHMLDTLSLDQRKAYDMVMSNEVCIIRGPTGTGKSYLGSVLAIALALRSSGIVICTAHSDYACDELYRKINAIHHNNDIKINKVCRVYGDARALLLKKGVLIRYDDTHTTKYEPIVALHNLVSTHGQYLSRGTKKISVISKLFEKGTQHFMTDEEKSIYYAHVNCIESSILQSYKILIMTADTLTAFTGTRRGENPLHQADSFYQTWLSGMDVTAKIVDESGAITVPTTLVIERLFPGRVVLMRDNVSMRPIVYGLSAEMAGLGFSLEKYLFVNKLKNGIPTMILSQQQRVHKDIMNLISFVSYDNKLKDMERIVDRKVVIPLQFFSENPQFVRNRVLIRVHKISGTQIGESWQNELEADLVIKSIKKYQKYISLDSMTVVTLHRAQKVLITRKLLTNQISAVECKTVDEFSAKDNTLVIISIAQTISTGNIGYLLEQNRLDVLLSRAKEMLVIFANHGVHSESAIADERLYKFIKYVTVNKLIASVGH